MFFDAFWSRPLVTSNNKNGSFSFKQTIFLKSLRVSDEKIELFQKNKAFLKIDWKHRVNISVYVRGGLGSKNILILQWIFYFSDPR